MTAGGRAQDQGRKHRKAGRPSAATQALLVTYQDVMRRELRDLLTMIDGEETPQLGLDGRPLRTRPDLGDRSRLWDLAVKLARELGGSIDDGTPADDDAPAPAASPVRRRRVDYGGA